jgi:hypothetical protein
VLKDEADRKGLALALRGPSRSDHRHLVTSLESHRSLIRLWSRVLRTLAPPRGCPLDYALGSASMKVVSPIVSSSPGRTRIGSVMRQPLRKVPLVDPASFSIQALPS